MVCTRLAGTVQPGVESATLTGCTVAPTGGSGAITNFTLNGGDVTWANGTSTDYTATAVQRGITCPPIAKEYVIHGTVTSSTNASIANGSAVKMKVCYTPSNFHVNLVTGTKIKFF